MTEEAAQARDEHVMSALAVILTAGHKVVCNDGSLAIKRTPDGQFEVRIAGLDSGLPTERDDVFDDVRSAVAYYLDLLDTST